jgi:hypothetical protein
MKKVRLEHLEYLVGLIDEEELIKCSFAHVDKTVKQVNEILKGADVEYPDIIILNGKEYTRPHD